MENRTTELVGKGKIDYAEGFLEKEGGVFKKPIKINRIQIIAWHRRKQGCLDIPEHYAWSLEENEFYATKVHEQGENIAV